MIGLNRFCMPAALAVALALPVLMNGCGVDPTNPGGNLCCTDFKVGADLSGADFGVDASIKGEFNVFAQAAGDFSATATGMLDDVAVACKNIAIDLGADKASQDAADAKGGRDGVKAWCDLAVAQIKGSFSASGKFAAAGTLSIKFDPPACSASISAKANCQAKCDVSGKCDLKANPPKCTGGSLEVECKGGCTASGGASLSCTGECTGNCSGSCEASGGVAVDCTGKCDGTCTAGAGAGETGIQADGSCKGKCSAKCTASATAPAVKCSGTCSGKCDAKCQGSANVAVKCDGTCDVEATPLKCEGGKLEGGCKVDANCDANCSASVSAKAECHPPQLTITASGSASLTGDVAAQFNVAIESLKVNLPNIILVFQARGKAFIDIGQGLVSAGASISGDAGKLNVKGSACALAIVGVIAEAAGNGAAAVDNSTSVAGSLSLN